MGLRKLFKERSNKSGPDGDGKLKKSVRLEESLQEIQGRYRKLLNHTQAIQYTHDLQGQFLSVDQEITEFLGYDRNSLLNMNIRTLLASEVRHKFEVYLGEIKRQGVSEGLMVVQTASGEKRILKYYNTLWTEDVATPFVQGIAYDVTEQKQTKKALKQLSEQLSIILKSLPIVCYISKAEEDYGATYITHNVKAITGFEQTDFTSKSSFWSDRVHPEDAPKIFADLPRIFEKGYHEHQYRWQVADGSYKWFYDYTRLIKSSDGKNYIIGMMQDITERKRAEEALLNAAQQWRTTFDGINDFVSLLDLDGKILRCNKAMKDFVGKPFNEIINHSCWEIILGATTPIEDCPFLRMKETLHRETTILSVNDLWFNVSVDPIFDQASRLIGAVNIISDITKRKQAEEALRLFERAIETLQLGLTITDSHGKIIYINLAEAKMHGYQVEELIGKDVRILAPREIWNPMTVEQLLKMNSWKRETINIRKDGSTFPVHLLSVVVPNVPGDALGVITTCEDISERKRAEVTFRRSEEKYRTILENIEDGYYEVDIAGNFTFFNDSICRIWGYPKEELMGMNDRQYTDQENAKKLFQAFNKVYRTGEPTKEVGWEIIRKDGTKRYIEASASLLKDSSGKPIGFRGIIRDVTEHIQAEEAVTRLSHENAIMVEIGRIISSTLNIDEVYERFSEQVRKLIPFDRISVNLINPDRNSITVAYAFGIKVGDLPEGAVLPLDDPFSKNILNKRQGVLILPEDESELAKNYPNLVKHFRIGIRSIMTVPLISKDQVIGLLHFQSLKPNSYTESDLKLSERIGNQIAGAIANAQLYAERKRAEEALKKSEEEAKWLSQENAVMAEIGRIISSTLNIDEVYERFSEEVRKLISFDRIMINIVNLKNNTTSFAFITGIDVQGRRVGDIVPLEGTATGECVRMRSSFLFQTESMDEVVKRFPGLLPTFKAGLRSMIFSPLISEDQVIGALSLRSTKPNAYTETDLRLAERVGNQIAGAVSNSQLFIERKRAEESAARFSKENAIMAEIGRVVSSTLNIDEVYERFVEEVRKLIPFDRIAVTIINYKDHTGTMAYASGVEVPNRKKGEVIPLKSLVYEKIIATRAGILIQTEDEKELEERYPGLLAIRAGFRSMISVPLISKDQVIGVLHLRSLKPNAYTESDLTLAERVCNQIAGAIANAQLFIERKQMEEALRKSEERFRDLYDHAPLGYHEYDAEGRITCVNRTDLEMLGYTAEEMIGQSMWKFNVGENTVREQILAKLAGTLRPGRNLERTYRRKDGTTFPVLIEDRLILDEKGQIKGIRCTIQDITERKRVEEEKASLKEQLRQSQKMEAIGKLAGGVAHDFNNLLTVIHGYSELMLNSLDQNSRLRQDVQEIMHASERASSLTRQLLAFSRKQVLQPKVLDLNAHVSNMDKMLRRMIGEDIELVTLLVTDLGRIKADPGQIEQVLLNLAVNAKDAMLSGGKLTIETANVKLDENYACSRVGVTPGDYVMLSMSDTGVGMAPETKERIFEPFFTTKDTGKGTGLGLSTVYGIIQQSGGNIWVYSEPGLGTTFKIYLPTIEGNTESLRPAAVSTKSLQGSETILLVEDEEMVRKLACTVLEKNGYRVLEASNGDKALDVVQGQNGNLIHLMVTDVVMPGMSGRQLADRLVSLQPELKVLYMSGYTDNAIVHHGVLDPGVAYIQKPFTPDALASKVREILDGN